MEPLTPRPASLHELSVPAAPHPEMNELLQNAAAGAFLGMVMDQAPPFWVADRDARLLFANRAYRDIAGDSTLTEHGSSISQVLATGQPVLRLDKRDVGGETRHYRVYMFPIAGKTQAAMAVGGLLHEATSEVRAVVQARTEKKRFQDVVRATSDWVWETDPDGRLTFVSSRITQLLGTPPVLLYGRTLDEIGIFPDGSANPAFGGPPQPFRDVALQIIGTGGETRHFSLSAVPVFDDAGKFSGYRGTASDISERLMAEAAVRRYQTRLEHALETLRNNNVELDLALQGARAASTAKSEFLATMSHELRTPLNAIIGFSEVIATGAFGPSHDRYSDYANDIFNSGRHLLRLIDDILELSSVQTGELQLACEDVLLADLIAQAVETIAGRAAEKRIRIETPSAPPGISLRIDRERTLQILGNLLSNAIKFSPEGGRVGIEVRCAEKESLGIAVRDTGSGVPPDKQAAIFDTFQQLHHGIFSRKQEGIGVGLPLSRELARAMRGDLVLDESSSDGSCFLVTLPRSLDPALTIVGSQAPDPDEEAEIGAKAAI